jgi:hypothetical protein
MEEITDPEKRGWDALSADILQGAGISEVVNWPSEVRMLSILGFVKRP